MNDKIDLVKVYSEYEKIDDILKKHGFSFGWQSSTIQNLISYKPRNDIYVKEPKYFVLHYIDSPLGIAEMINDKKMFEENFLCKTEVTLIDRETDRHGILSRNYFCLSILLEGRDY